MLQAKHYHSLILQRVLCILFFGYVHLTQKLDIRSEAHIERKHIRKKCSAPVAHIGNGIIYAETLKM